ncbi:MAG TPA: hypothetical protein DC054_00225, partial [Blastocatellia bacterium]|nr:hypothetical protein [Blastocatellia bacterium]
MSHSHKPRFTHASVLNWRVLVLVLACGLGSSLVMRKARAHFSAQPAPVRSGVSADAKLATLARAQQAYGQLPLSFEANEGQTDQRVKFLTYGSGYELFLTSGEAVFRLENMKREASVERSHAATSRNAGHLESQILRLKFLGANRSARVSGLDQLAAKSNYFIGSDPAKWRTNVSNYAKVKYENIYRGVDIVFYGNRSELEYDFVVAPGGDLNKIRFAFAGTRVSVDDGGDLILRTQQGEVRQLKPVIYQMVNGSRRIIDGRYLTNGNQVSFEVGTHDKTLPLVIDPSFQYFTYLGGTRGDQGLGIAVDVANCAYVTGYASSTFPTTPGSYQQTFGGGSGVIGSSFDSDVFVTKMNPTGTGLVFSTYVGGAGAEAGRDIKVDPITREVYVTGNTFSENFPTTPGAFQTALNLGVPQGPFNISDAFVIKMDSAGSTLVYSTLLGGSNTDNGFGIDIDAAGNAYVTGNYSGSDFPVTAGAYQTTPAFSNGFVSKLNPNGTALVYSTFIGGNGAGSGFSIAVDSLGDAYVAGTGSFGFSSVTPGAFQTTSPGDNDAFALELNPSGSALIYGTLLGGTNSDEGRGIAVDANGNAYVSGQTASADFPVTPGAFQSTSGGGGSDTFALKLNTDGSALIYSTYLGGSGPEQAGKHLAIDVTGNLFLTGSTGSTDFPIQNGFQPFGGGGNGDPFITMLNTTGTGVVYSSYLGGNGNDIGNAVAVDFTGAAYVTGLTNSTNLATTAGAFQQTHDPTFGDAFVAKIGTVSTPTPTPTPTPT